MKLSTILIFILFPLIFIGQSTSRSGNFKLDSTINTTYFYSINLLDTTTKFEYEYNSYGSITSQKEYSFYSIGQQWGNLRKQEYQYNNAGNLTQYTYFFWNQSSSHWDITQHGKSIYNTINQLVLYLNLTWNNPTNVIDTSSTTAYTYDQNGNIETKIQTFKEHLQNIWIPANKEEYFYDHLQRDTLYQYSYWDSLNSQWFLSSQIKNSYNSNGTKASHSRFSFDETMNLWYLNSEHIYSYNANGEVIKDSVTSWHTNLQTIINTRLTTYQYNSNGDLQEILTQFWDNTQMSWYNYRKFNSYYTQTFLDSSIRTKWNQITLTFDNEGKTEYDTQQAGAFTLKNDYYWNQNTQKWIPKQFNEYNYDLSISVNTLTHPVQYNDYDYLLISRKGYYTAYSYTGWTTNNTTTTFYSPVTPNSIQNYEPISISVYPNPSTDFIQFNTGNGKQEKHLFIYNLDGDLLITQVLNGNNKVNINHLSNGYYLYSILIKGQLVSGKFVKK